MAKKHQGQTLFDEQPAAKPQGPVECLGMTFENVIPKHSTCRFRRSSISCSRDLSNISICPVESRKREREDETLLFFLDIITYQPLLNLYRKTQNY